MEQAVAKVEGGALALTQSQAQAQVQGLVISDVIIPRMLLMQGTSDFVKERKAQLGDMVKSTTLEAFGSPEKPIAFIPLKLPSGSWIREVKPKGTDKGRWEFRGIEPRNAGNDTLPWRFAADKDGKEVTEGSNVHTHEGRRVKSLSAYVILPSDIDAEAAELAKAARGEFPDLSKALTPVLVAFRSTSFPAGKEISTFFTQASRFKQPAWKYQIELACHMEANDQGSFYVFDVNRNVPKPVKPEHLPEVEKWANIVSSQDLKVDTSNEEGDIDEASGPTQVGGKQAF